MLKDEQRRIEEKKKLKQLVEEGISVREIVAVFYKSEGGIRQKVRCRGLEVAVKTPLSILVLLQLLLNLKQKG